MTAVSSPSIGSLRVPVLLALTAALSLAACSRRIDPVAIWGPDRAPASGLARGDRFADSRAPEPGGVDLAGPVRPVGTAHRDRSVPARDPGGGVGVHRGDLRTR